MSAQREKINKNPKKKMGKVASNLLSILICIFIFIFAFAGTALVAVKQSTNPDNIEKMVKNIDDEAIMSMMKSTEEVNEIVGAFSARDVAEILEETSVGDYVADYISDSIQAIMAGEEPDEILSYDITELMYANHDEIAEISGYELTEYDYYVMDEYFDRNGDVLSTIFSEGDTPLVIVSIFASTIFVVAIFVVVLLLVVLLFAVRNWKVGALLWSGITVVISSVVLIIVGAVKPIILGFVPNVAEVFVDMYLSSAVWSFVMVGTVTLLVGVALIAIYVIANKILENRKQKAIA